MWILVALVGVVLVMARWARVESTAAGNRVAAVQAATAARAGEQYVISQIEQAAGDTTTLAEAQFEAVPIGPTADLPTAYFWVMRPDREEDQYQDFGVDDEGSKININTANRDTLMRLPGMTEDVADAIIDWRDTDENPGASGAESDYYETLQPPYRCKNGPFETVEELLLVKGVTPDLLYGYDANHNGFLNEEEVAATGGGSLQESQEGSLSPRGLLPFVSVYGVGPPPSTTTATTGTGGTGGTGTGGTGTGGTGTGGTGTGGTGTGGQGTGGGGQGGATAVNPGLVNVGTASREVLRALPGMEDADAMSLTSARDGGVDLTSTAWVATIISQQKAAAINGLITAKSTCFSADVLGVSADGRAFHRVRVMIDGSKSPPAIISRRDLTALGWPLGQDLRLALRNGAGLTGSGMLQSVRSTTLSR
jgi:DNA uptake protein ComE-like DNA-binding protein